jgi:hypothetical protein
MVLFDSSYCALVVMKTALCISILDFALASNDLRRLSTFKLTVSSGTTSPQLDADVSGSQRLPGLARLNKRRHLEASSIGLVMTT